MTRAREAGVTHIFMPNIDSTTIEPMLRMQRVSGILLSDDRLASYLRGCELCSRVVIVAQELESLNEYVAIGEIGMDLYWDKTFLKEQQIVLDKQIEWALEYKLPVVIHCREAFDYIYDVLKPYQDTSLKGIS